MSVEGSMDVMKPETEENRAPTQNDGTSMSDDISIDESSSSGTINDDDIHPTESDTNTEIDEPTLHGADNSGYTHREDGVTCTTRDNEAELDADASSCLSVECTQSADTDVHPPTGDMVTDTTTCTANHQMETPPANANTDTPAVNANCTPNGDLITANVDMDIGTTNDNMDSDMLDPAFDQYGFLCDESGAEYPRYHDYQKRPEYDPELIGRWRTMLKEENWQKYHKSTGKIRSYIQSGVPDCLRGELWMKLLDGEMLAMKANFSYKANVVAVREQLVELGICEFKVTESLNVLGNMKDVSEGQKHNSTDTYIHCDTLRQIFCDVERSYPTHKFFLNHSCNGQEGCATLFRLLAVYARYNRHVGYCQGMSYLAGLLLMQMPEVEAFWCLVALFERQKYLQGFYDNSLLKMKSYAAVFKKLMSHRLPAITNHLRSLDLQPLMFLTPWFMCVFTDLPCWDTVLAIWDLFMLDGVSTLFRVALAVMETFESDLLKLGDLSKLLPELLHLPSRICEYEILMPAILSTNIEPWEVRSLLAVISEEENIRQNRKRVLSGNAENLLESDVKRQRIQTAEQSSPSIFRRLVNFFTGRSDQKGVKRSHPSHTQRLLQRQYTVRASKRKYIQSANCVNPPPPSEEFGGTPKTLTDENTAHSRAIDDFSFKVFNTPAQPRWDLGRQSALPLATLNSPEVELESMTSK